MSSSEPILSEAAYFVMQRGKVNAPVALKSVMDGSFLDIERRPWGVVGAIVVDSRTGFNCRRP